MNNYVDITNYLLTELSMGTLNQLGEVAIGSDAQEKSILLCDTGELSMLSIGVTESKYILIARSNESTPIKNFEFDRKNKTLKINDKEASQYDKGDFDRYLNIFMNSKNKIVLKEMKI